MARRVLTLALALAVAGVPLAGEICRALCADHGQHHNHHADAAPVSRTATIGAVAHSCGEATSLVADSRDIVRTSIASATITAAADPGLLVHAPATNAVESRHGPPGIVRLPAQLRI